MLMMVCCLTLASYSQKLAKSAMYVAQKDTLDGNKYKKNKNSRESKPELKAFDVNKSEMQANQKRKKNKNDDAPTLKNSTVNKNEDSIIPQD